MIFALDLPPTDYGAPLGHCPVDVITIDESPVSDAVRQPAKNAAQNLAEPGWVLIIIVSHLSAVSFANQSEGTAEKCLTPLYHVKFTVNGT